LEVLKIRQGDTDDIISLISLGREMHKESPRFKGMDYDEEKLIHLGIGLAEQGGIFLAEKNGKPIGMVLGMVTEHFFGHDLMATDLAVYVHPDHRGGTLVVRLIKKFEAWAFSMGAKVISMGVSTEVEADRTGQLYKRLGYRMTGCLAVKERLVHKVKEAK
jgi:GNAT superfamily N-acetyltransferase